MKYFIYECVDCSWHYVVSLGALPPCYHCHSVERKEICRFDDILKLMNYMFTFQPLLPELLHDSYLKLEWAGSCTNCGVGEATDDCHPCPLASEIEGDSSDRCTCCPDCEDSCAADI